MKVGVAVTVLPGGERLPILLDEQRLPLHRPLIWLMSMRRPRNLAANTLKAELYAVGLLYEWAEGREINLEEKIMSGCPLSPHEQVSLIDFCKSRKTTMSANVYNVPTYISSNTAANRLRAIISYLEWMGNDFSSNVKACATEIFRSKYQQMLLSLRTRLARQGGRNVVGMREGPPQSVIDSLIKSIDPDEPSNPWTIPTIRTRNQLLIRLLLGLGIRRGEALAIKIDHIDFRQNKLLIARSADDPIDTRRQQPTAKTRDRILPLQPLMAEMIYQYITTCRSRIAQARRHPFLFVSHKDGQPLSIASVNKMFRVLRNKIPELPANLTAHLLRHAWNDHFSKLIDAHGINHIQEAKLRSELMGWSPTSSTATIYNKRKIREDAEKLMLSQQSALGVATREK